MVCIHLHRGFAVNRLFGKFAYISLRQYIRR